MKKQGIFKERYKATITEKKWQNFWKKNKTFRLDLAKSKNPFYNLSMFPYPSAEGLHVGHIIPYSGSDTFGRYMRMKGYEVFEPMGFDAFGIHSENFAIKKGLHPAKLTRQTTRYFKDKQMKKLGTMFDWDRMVDTSDPSYYQWTQWLFVQMFKAGLALRKKALVNWCPGCKTVLSDEQVLVLAGQSKGNGILKNEEIQQINACERCKTEVERREMEQWFFKITAYSERLLAGTYKIDWSEKTLTAQRNWIGRKEGINITYKVEDKLGKEKGEIICFTTRPETNFGATFVVISPEHPFVNKLLEDSEIKLDLKSEINIYFGKAKNKSEQERIAQGREKTGVFTGLYCLNQLTGREMPLWISDFVLMGFGTGAVVGVPGHDLRDFEFAKQFNLPIIRVVIGLDGENGEIIRKEQVQEENGRMINSGFLDGLEIREAITKMMDFLEEKKWGKRKIHYRLRDWCISRQRYWGPPIPMVYCPKCAKNKINYYDYLLNQANKKEYTTSKDKNSFPDKSKIKITRENFSGMEGWFPEREEKLPLLLPKTEDYLPDGSGKSPLAKIAKFVNTICPNCKEKALRETDVSDTFLDSAWYFLRYPSVGLDSMLEKTNKEAVKRLPFDREITKKWLPVDMYIGGNEHACLHLMYSRFVTMALFDMGFISFEEPFKKFYAHGLMIKDGFKMSKSRGNIVNPDLYLNKYGADTLRMYVLFLGPYNGGGDFRDSGMEGMSKFLERIYRWSNKIIDSLKSEYTKKLNIEANEESIDNLNRRMQRLIKAVGEDLEKLKFNTAIAKMMTFLNEATSLNIELNRNKRMLEILEEYVLILAPFAPHLAEEIFQLLKTKRKIKNKGSIHDQKWPEYDPKALEEKMVKIVVQFNGKVRTVLDISKDLLDKKTAKEELEKLIRKNSKLEKYFAGKIRRIIYVPFKVINFVEE